eukprot:scaffold2303_cov141-Skeletonema_menzelii.AAC.8
MKYVNILLLSFSAAFVTADNLRSLISLKDTRFHCDKTCFEGIAQCKKQCNLQARKGVHRAFCDGGNLPQKCQQCCQHKDTGCYCNKECMKSIAVCNSECPIRNNLGRTYCTDLKKGWNNIPGRAYIPKKCLQCCPGCDNVVDIDIDIDTGPDVCDNFATCSASCTASASANCQATAIAKCTAECSLSKRQFLPPGSSSSSSSSNSIAIAIAEADANSSSLCGCTHCCCGVLQCSAKCVAKAMAKCQALATSSCNASCTATICS